MSTKNETPKAPDSAPLPSLTDDELNQVIGGIARPILQWNRSRPGRAPRRDAI